MENPPAFPFPAERNSWGDGIREGSDGMTLRDWFAGQAIGHIMGAALADKGQMPPPWKLAQAAYATADAMLTARAGDA